MASVPSDCAIELNWRQWGLLSQTTASGDGGLRGDVREPVLFSLVLGQLRRRDVPRQQRFDLLDGDGRWQMLEQIVQVRVRLHVIGAGRSCRAPDYAEWHPSGAPTRQETRSLCWKH